MKALKILICIALIAVAIGRVILAVQRAKTHEALKRYHQKMSKLSTNSLVIGTPQNTNVTFATNYMEFPGPTTLELRKIPAYPLINTNQPNERKP